MIITLHSLASTKQAIFAQQFDQESNICLRIYISRGESYSVQDRTGPRTGLDRTGPDRTGPVQFGPVLGPPNFLIRSSVRSRSGLVDRIKWVARSCPSARLDRAPKKIGGTGTPCHFSTLSIPRTCPVRSGPGFDRSGPVLGPDLDSYSVLGPDRSGPVRSGTELQPYISDFLLVIIFHILLHKVQISTLHSYNSFFKDRWP